MMNALRLCQSRSRLAVIAIVLCAAAVRLIHINWDEYHFFHPDERAVAFAVQRVSFQPLQLDPDFFAYGSLPIYLAKITSSTLGLVTPRAASYDGIILNGRRLSAVIGTLTVFLLILLGSRLYDRGVGLLAGGLLAACTLHIQNSRFMTVDVTLTFVVLVALTALVQVARDGRVRHFVFAGIAIGLATATKFSAMPLFLPLAVAALHRVAVERRFLSVAGRCSLAVAAALLAFAVAEPYGVLRFSRFFHDIFEQSHMVRNAGVFPYTTQYMGTPKYWYDLAQLVLWGMAPALGVAAVWASATRVVTAWRERRIEDWVLLSWVVPFFLITGWFEVKFPRYLLPIYPFMILWAADWLLWKYRSGTLFGRIAAPVVVAGTVAAAAAFLAIYTRPFTEVTASEWVYRHVPSGSKILTQDWDEGFPLPLPRPEGRAERYTVVPFGYYGPDSPAKIQQLSQELASADYVIFQTKRLYGAVTRAPERYPLTTSYFYKLFAGDLGYTLVQEVASRPSVFGFEIPDELADESLTVYDHPKILIFRNTERLAAPVLADKILRGLPSQALTRNDLLLARPSAGAPLEATGAAPPIRSGLLAALLFVALVEVLSLSVYPILRTWLTGVGTLALSKTFGLLCFGYLSWLLISVHAATFAQGPLCAIIVALAGAGTLMWRRPHAAMARAEIVSTEGLFWGAFAFFLLVRMYNPEVYWGEKPMDFSFLNALTRTASLPPPEPWFAGSPLHYSYFGHYLVAALGKALHLDPALTFNLGIALVGGLTAVAAFALGAAVTGQWRLGLLAASFVALVGNLAGPREWWARHAVNFDYFWATSRVIRDTINEFPLWSFLFADLHAHVLVMPLSLTFLCLAVMWVRTQVVAQDTPRPRGQALALLVCLCVTLGAIMVTNTWSSPTYILFFVFLSGALWLTETPHQSWLGFVFDSLIRVILPSILLVAGAYTFFHPYWRHFVGAEGTWLGWERLGPDRLVHGRDFLTIFGLFLFVLVPFVLALWMRGTDQAAGRRRGMQFALLGGVIALTCGSLFISTRAFAAVLFLLTLRSLLAPNTDRQWRIPLTMATFAFAITAGCDLVFVWDRMNTLFKFYLEAWFLFATAAAAAAGALWSGTVALPGLRRLWQVGLTLLIATALFTTATDTVAVIRTNRVVTPKPTLDGMAYLRDKAPLELAAYEWLNRHIQGIPVLLEAHGDSYQEFSRVSMNTGLPTVLGWGYHVLQRGHRQVDIARRKNDIEAIYTSNSKEKVAALLQHYEVALIVVGALERRTYAGANLARFTSWTDLVTPVYQNPGITIFAVNGRFSGTMPVTTIADIPQAGTHEPPPQDAPGKLQQPRGVAVTPNGDVVVCDFGNHRIQEFARDLTFVREWGSHGELPGQFKEPCGIAVAPSGEIFVADTWNQRVQEFSATGEYVREWGTSFYGPRGIAVDARGSVFVADTGNNRIVRFSSTGQKEVEWGAKGPEPGHFLEPIGLAVDATGTVYVCDNGNGRLQMFSRDGAFISAFPVAGWESKVYSEPNVVLDPRGTMWLTVPGSKEVRNYDRSGKLLRTITGQSTPGAVFGTPMGITYDPTTHELVISDLDHRLVRVPTAQP
ncbi:MAG: hypothetical protein H6Q33_1136 [Deltaproteobacteria bacterium]|nr:hypothetical protein [Deltaproteobacteria bacterium]